tara:strand:- start:2099 stop:2944 length:846 start_codon:yes stop_codon:yes gene_type:complete
MPYIGKAPSSGEFIELDALTASATDTYTLQYNGANYKPETVNNLIVSINGVVQKPSSMSLNGSSLTVGATLSSSDTIDYIRVLGHVGSVITPTDGSVTSSKLDTNIAISGNLDVGTIRATNGTTAMTIDSSGRVLQPSVPAFRVGLTSSQSVTSSGSFVDVAWNEGTTSESDNCFTQGGFSWSSGVVTAPISGIYHVDLLARIDGVSSGYIIMIIQKNNEVSGNKELYSIEGSPASSYQAVSGSGIFKLVANDTLKVRYYPDSDSSTTITTDSIFSGHLIG